MKNAENESSLRPFFIFIFHLKEARNRGGSMSVALNIGKCTLLGNYRENNEDAIDVKLFPDLTICIVADGMGGQAAGEIASKQAIEVIPREIRKGLAVGADADTSKSIIRK